MTDEIPAAPVADSGLSTSEEYDLDDERAGETERDNDTAASDQSTLAKSAPPQSAGSTGEREEHPKTAEPDKEGVDGRWVAFATGIVAFVLGWWVGR